MSFNYSKLRGRIIEKFGTIEAFAQATNLSMTTISKYLNNKVPWKQTSINDAVRVLDIKPEEISLYFFTPDVQNIEQNKVKA